MREHDATSFFTEFSEGDGTTYDGTSDGSEADDGSFDDESSWDDATRADSVGSSYLSGEGFRIGQTNFVIKTLTFKDVFPMWGASSGPPEVKEVTKHQTSMFQNFTLATSFGVKSEALLLARSESSLEMIQANVIVGICSSTAFAASPTGPSAIENDSVTRTTSTSTMTLDAVLHALVTAVDEGLRERTTSGF